MKAPTVSDWGHRSAFLAIAIAITIIVAITYWPVHHASFVWDDLQDFPQTAWLRQGSEWQQIIFRRFNGWYSYFRPLGVAFFTIQVRLFDVRPGPMHIVSLCMHLVNTLLVGTLARKICARQTLPIHPWVQWALPMLLYGLHPILIEPVAWIGCQFDLLVVLLMLLGLIANASFERTAIRAMGVSCCFFLAAGAKEAAVAFPLFLVTFDWFALNPPAGAGKSLQLKMLLQRNGLVYASVFLAGITYLAVRRWALGSLVPGLGDEPLSSLARLQEVSFIYIRYWQMLFWPTAGIGPVHPVLRDAFFSMSASTIVADVLAIGIVLAGIILALRRAYAGAVILSVTAGLIPVLHIIGLNLDASLYHERYNMPGLAIACAWLPCTLQNLRIPARLARISVFGGYAIALVWLMLSLMNIRAIAPLWANEISLWQWAEEQHPDFIEVQDHLISAYIDAGHTDNAWKIINYLTKKKLYCMNCMLNAAHLAAAEGQPDRALFFLERIEHDSALYDNPNTYRFYLTTRTEIFLLQGNPVEADHMARSAIKADALDPEPYFLLASALTLQKKWSEAQQVESTAIELTSPQERAQRKRDFEESLRALHAQTEH